MKYPPNPIQLFVWNAIATGRMTHEKFCVIADLKYKTWQTNIYRPKVSPMVRMALKVSGGVPSNLIEKYDQWLVKTYKPLRDKELSRDRKIAARNPSKFTKPDQGVSGTYPAKEEE